MGFAKIHGRLTSRVMQRVRFGAPQDVQRSGGSPIYGTIVDEVWANPRINIAPMRRATRKHHWGDYSFCAQRIRWDDGTYTIRLAYYRRRVGQNWWEFASQTTVNTDPSTIKSLMTKTLARNQWFK